MTAPTNLTAAIVHDDDTDQKELLWEEFQKSVSGKRVLTNAAAVAQWRQQRAMSHRNLTSARSLHEDTSSLAAPPPSTPPETKKKRRSWRRSSSSGPFTKKEGVSKTEVDEVLGGGILYPSQGFGGAPPARRRRSSWRRSSIDSRQPPAENRRISFKFLTSPSMSRRRKQANK